MCVVIDTCVIHGVFDLGAKAHKRFAPILDWLLNGNGKMVYGGKKYKDELKATIGKYRSILAELQRQGKIIDVDDDAVDMRQRLLERVEANKDFDDPHLVAIVIESGCRIVCTDDKRAIPFLKKRGLYPKPAMRPKIFNNSSPSQLKIIRDRRNFVRACE